MTLTRRTFLAGSAAAATATAAPSRPNLVYVFADQLGYHHCGYAGDEDARTPNLDKLASQSCNFRQTISNSPVCAPYRASLMTGKHQSSTGMVINELRLSPEHRCFGHVLTSAGYRTAYIGKWHLWANQLGAHELTRNGFVPPGPYRLGFDGLWAGYNFSHNYYGGPYFRDTPDRQIWKGYEPDSQTDMAIDFIQKSRTEQQPFALFLSWGPPHSPWTKTNVPAKHREMFRDARLPFRPNFSEVQDPYADNWAKLPKNPRDEILADMRIYYGQTTSIDDCLGRLTGALDAAGLTDNTILVFTSDHGEMFGSHGRTAKYIFYEEAARVPMLVRWPSHIPAGSKSDVPLGTPDIMPTLLSMMGLEAPRTAEGEDVSRHALGKGGVAERELHMQGMGTTAAWQDGTEWRALRDSEYTYAVYHRDRHELLFDNRRDPYQMKNLVDDRSQTAKLKHYRESSVKWRQQHGDSFESCTWYRDRWVHARNIVDTGTGIKQDLQKLDQLVRHYYPEGIPDPDR